VTLIEVLGSLVLVATLLASMLSIKSDATRQYSNARRRLQAIRAADDLLTRWWPPAPGSRSSPASEGRQRDSAKQYPREDSGTLPNQRLVWRTEPVDNDEITQLGLEVIRLEILDQDQAETDKPLAYVEIILPKPPQIEAPETARLAKSGGGGQ